MARGLLLLVPALLLAGCASGNCRCPRTCEPTCTPTPMQTAVPPPAPPLFGPLWDAAFERRKAEIAATRGDPTHRLGVLPSTPFAEGAVLSWAKVSKEQVEYAAAHGLPVAFENSIGMRFVLIPPGTFQMGSPLSEAGRFQDETPYPPSRLYYLTVNTTF